MVSRSTICRPAPLLTKKKNMYIYLQEIYKITPRKYTLILASVQSFHFSLPLPISGEIHEKTKFWKTKSHVYTSLEPCGKGFYILLFFPSLLCWRRFVTRLLVEVTLEISRVLLQSIPEKIRLQKKSFII